MPSTLDEVQNQQAMNPKIRKFVDQEHEISTVKFVFMWAVILAVLALIGYTIAQMVLKHWPLVDSLPVAWGLVTCIVIGASNLPHHFWQKAKAGDVIALQKLHQNQIKKLVNAQFLLMMVIICAILALLGVWFSAALHYDWNETVKTMFAQQTLLKPQIWTQDRNLYIYLMVGFGAFLVFGTIFYSFNIHFLAKRIHNLVTLMPDQLGLVAADATIKTHQWWKDFLKLLIILCIVLIPLWFVRKRKGRK